MKRTKTLALLLAVAMLLVLAAGCGSSGSNSSATEAPVAEESEATEAPATEAPAPAAEEAEAPAEEPAPEEAPEEAPAESEPAGGDDIFPLAQAVELSFYCPLQPFTMPYGIGPEQMYNFQYMEDATNVVIDLDCINFMQVSETFNIMIASQDYPDFIGSFEQYYNNGADDAIEQDIVIDLMPYMDNELVNYKNALSEDRDMWMYSLTPEGHLVSANYLMPGGEPSTAGLMYREDWLDELGMEVPQTYDELYAYMTACRDSFGAKGMMLQDVGCDTEFSLAGGFDTMGYTSETQSYHPFLQIDNVVEYGPSNEGYREYLNLLSQWFAEGLIYPDYASIAWNEQMDYIAQGEVSLWSSSYDAAQTVLTNSDDTVHLMGMTQPTKEAGDKVHISKGITKIIQGTAISTQCRDLETALAWINYRYGDEGRIITGYGKEGETFEYVNGKPELTDLVIHNEDYVLIVAVNIYTTYGTPATVDPVRYSGGWTDLDAAVIQCFDDSDRDWAYFIPSSYVFLDSSVAQDYSAIMSDIATYVMQYAAQVISGEKNTEGDWDAYLAQLDSMGLAEATEYMQSAWDQYLAKEQYIPA